MARVMDLAEAVELIDRGFAGAKITAIDFDDERLELHARRDNGDAAFYYRLVAEARDGTLHIHTDARAEPWPPSSPLRAAMAPRFT